MKKPYVDNIPEWAALRRSIIDRDRFICRICGAEDGEARLNVHHIDMNRAHNQHDNLVTLCSACHHAVHAEGYQPGLYEDWPIPWGQHPPMETVDNAVPTGAQP